MVQSSNVKRIKIQDGETSILIETHNPDRVQVREQKSVDINDYTHQEILPPSEDIKEEEKEFHVIKSPLVGTFYRSPSPGAPPFVEVGDTVSPGQVLCIIEALKVMNEIESDVKGRVEKILVENGESVEYGQPLFLINTEV